MRQSILLRAHLRERPDRARMFRALADPRRVEIVDHLARDGSMCGTDLAAALNISLPLLCHHWEVPVDAGILMKKRVGQIRVCSLDMERIREATGSWKTPAPKRGRRRPSP